MSLVEVVAPVGEGHCHAAERVATIREERGSQVS